MEFNEDLVHDDEPYFEGIEVKAATLEKLIQYCINQFDNLLENETDSEKKTPIDSKLEDDGSTIFESNSPQSFQKIFFLTFHWFITPEELFKKFIEIFDESCDANTEYSQIKIIKAVKYWLDNFGHDFEKNENLLSELNIFNTKVSDCLGEKGHGTTLNLDKWYKKKEIHRIRLESSKRRPSLNFNDMHGEELGEQMCFINWKSLRKIPVVEWKIYGKSAKTNETPSLKEQITLFNNISRYIMAMVLSPKTAEERAKSMHKFISMARRLQELGDYNTLLAIVGGLSNSSICRLHKTFELLSVEDKLFMKEIHQFLASDKNYSTYRMKIETMKSSWHVPILGVIMHDLVALETVVKDYIVINDKSLINFRKMSQVAGILENLMVATTLQPAVTPKKEVFNVIRVSLKSRYTEDDLYELSLQREPRVNGSTPSRASISGAAFFAEWASGDVSIPDRNTVEKHVNSMVDAVFKTYDLDRNGSINKTEFDALATNFPFIDEFAVLDVNCDGNISRQEMSNYFMNVNSQEMTKEFVHNFQEQSFYSPHYCVYCMGFIQSERKSNRNRNSIIYKVLKSFVRGV